MELYKNQPSTHGCLTGLKNKTRTRQTDELLAVEHTQIVNLWIQSTNLGEKCVSVCVPIRTILANLVTNHFDEEKFI